MIDFTAYNRLIRRQPIAKGAFWMDCETLWRLFLTTGLPEAYALFARLREEEAREERGKSA